MDHANRARISERFSCDIAVQACTTLESRPARIVDLSSHGAKVGIETPYAPGAQIHLDVDGDFVWATVAWAEVDRMGLRFTTPLTVGHQLHRRLQELSRRTALSAPRMAQQRNGFGRKAA